LSDQGIGQYKGDFVEIELASHAGEAKEYRVEEANLGMVILREKGKSSPFLAKEEDIISFTPPAPKPPAPLKAKRIKPIESENVKRHLVDMHAYRVADINGISEEEAVRLHDSIDHQELDLGHFHALSKREQAIAEDGPSSDANESQNEEEESESPF